MALPLAKLTLLIGAGVVGSVLASEVKLPGVSDILSGALKTIKVINNAGQNDKTTSSAKPRDDALIQQVIILREELQHVSSINKSVTVVTSTGSSGRKTCGFVIIVVVVGYGFFWWKGWKLPDLMFATRGSLKDATTAVGKELDNVHGSLATTKRHLSSRIDRVDCSLVECAEITAATREEVSALQQDTSMIKMDVQSVHNAVYSLEIKLHRLGEIQDDTNFGVKKLIDKAISVEQNEALPAGSSRQALEMPQMTSSERATSLPPIRIEEISSPSSASNGPPKVKRLQSDVSASGLKALHGDTDVVQALNTPRVPYPAPAQITEEGNPVSRVFRRSVSGGVGALSLFCSATKSR